VSALDRFIAYQAENVSHADEDAELEWECLIAELQDERDRLRAERDGWKKLCTDQEVMHIMREEALNNENARLRERCADLYAEMITYSDAPNYNASVWAPKLRELGIEVK